MKKSNLYWYSLLCPAMVCLPYPRRNAVGEYRNECPIAVYVYFISTV